MNTPKPAPSGARFIALGILLSKVGGLLREMIIARFFGVGAHADVIRSAFRAPNVLQNMLGEQTLSAAFIPFYSRMLGEGRREDAGRFAGAVFGLLTAAVSALVLLGVVFAPAIVSVLAAGFLGDAAEVAAGTATVDRFALTVVAVRIIFPMTGFLVLSAWALGVLNSHRRFLWPYLSPVVWNASIITALIWVAGGATRSDAASSRELDGWLLAVCYGALIGGLLQLVVQLPLVFRLMRGFRVSISARVEGVREALDALWPALAGRGVVQLSFYVDMFLASWLARGAPSALGFAVILINLPLGAFGMAVAAAELPELARVDASQANRKISERIVRAVGQSAFVVAPSVVGYLAFGYLVTGLVFRGGSFTRVDNALVYGVLCAYTLGLWASALSRLLQNAFFALRDTRTPARIATVRLAASAILGALLMIWLDRYAVAETFSMRAVDKELYLGAVGLGLAASFGAWCELALLSRALRRRVSGLRFPTGRVAGHFGRALVIALPAALLWMALPAWSVARQALVVLPVYAAGYLVVAWWLDLPDLELWIGRLWRRR